MKNQEIKIEVSQKMAFEMLHSALCNGALTYLSYSGIQLDYSDIDYQNAKLRIIKKGGIDKGSICIEDVWIEIVKGGKNLILEDVEGGEEKWTLNKNTFLENIKIVPLYILDKYIEENDDAGIGFDFLQYVFMGDVIFG